MKIEDATGKGYGAEVDAQNRLVTFAIVVPEADFLNENGAVFHIPLDAVAPSGATFFFYLMNTSSVNIHVTAIRFISSVTGIYRLSKVTGTAAAGTALTSSNMNLGSSGQFLANAQSGTSITGLTEAAVLTFMGATANTQFDYVIPSDVIMTPNTSIAIKAPAAATVSGIISTYFDF